MTTIKMSELTKALQDQGVDAYLEMTGGNCATILIGNEDAEGFYEFAVGPGNYSGDFIYDTEICWGKDGDQDATYYTGTESDFTVANLANVIAKDYFNATAFACGSCGLGFDSGSQGHIAINEGFIEFTCNGCKEVK